MDFIKRHYPWMGYGYRISRIFSSMNAAVGYFVIVIGYFLIFLHPTLLHKALLLEPYILVLASFVFGFSSAQKGLKILSIIKSVVRGIIMTTGWFFFLCLYPYICLILTGFNLLLYSIAALAYGIHRFCSKRVALWNTSIHEAGHCLLNLIEYPGTLIKVSIIPNGTSLGRMEVTPSGDMNIHKKIRVILAGAVSQRVILEKYANNSELDQKGLIGVVMNEFTTADPALSEEWGKYDSSQLTEIYEQFIYPNYLIVKEIVSQNVESIVELARSVYRKKVLDSSEVGLIMKVENVHLQPV